MTTLHAFDTLAYTRALEKRGFTKEQAECLAEVNQEYLTGEMVTKEFVRNEILELKIWTGKALIGAVGFMTAAIPLIMTIIQKMG